MHRSISKNSLILLSSLHLILTGCAAANPPPIPVTCHEWNVHEKVQIRNGIETLPNDSMLLSVLEDYQRVCATLK